MIEVKTKNGTVRCCVEITDKAVYCKTLMEEEYVLLSFESDEAVDFSVKDYITTDFGVFYIKDVDTPTIQSDGGYLYEQKFVALWTFWENHILFYDRQSALECSWKMTQRPEYFLEIVVSNLKDAGFGTYTYEIDSSLTEMQLVTFDSSSIVDALTAIAEAWDTEWWISGSVIHLSKCSIGTALELTEGDELSSVEGGSSQSSDTYMNRAYVFGSTRNLPTNYRKSSGDIVVEGVVETRLKLPEGTPYIEAAEGLSEDEIVEGVIVTDDIYPRNVGTISTVTTHQYTDTTDNEDGTETKTNWNAYRFTDDTLPTFKEEYRLAGEELRIVFQSGKLAGMDFEVNFNPDGASETAKESQVFEIVRSEDYGIKLPSDDFHPEVGDTYVLYGYDSQYVYDNLITKAENELLEAGKKKLAEYSLAKTTYTCDTNLIRCAGYIEKDGSLIHSDADEIDLEVGQVVTLKSSVIGGGSITSRVYGFEKRLDNKYNCTYTIGDSSSYSRRADLQDQINELTYQSNQFIKSGSSSVYIIKRYDNTSPSDYNVYSALRSDKQYLRKDKADSTPYQLTMEKAVVRTDADIKGNLSVGGSSDLNETTFGNAKVPYIAGEQGGKVSILDDGVKLQVDYLEVTRKMTAHEIEVMKTSHIGGRLMNSAASMICSFVYTIMNGSTPSGYVCFFNAKDGDGREIDNCFAVNDQALCQTFNIKTGTTSGFSNQYYWRKVTAISYTPKADITDSINGVTYAKGTTYGNCIVLSAADCASGSTTPLAGDEIVQLGNRTDTSRQGAIVQSATGTAGEVPYMRYYKGINSYTLPTPFIQFAPSSSWMDATEVIIRSSSSGDVTIEKYVGQVLTDAKTYADGKASDAESAANSYTDGKISPVSEALGKIESQMDESFYVYHGETAATPTLDNLPASEWTDEATKAEHIGDFYVASDGFCWQFRQDENYNYIWAEVNDRYLTAYVQAIAEKKRVFISRPTADAVYDEGDLWVNATYTDDNVSYANDTLVCITAKKKGDAFSISHWQAASGVTAAAITKLKNEVIEYADGLWSGSSLVYKDAQGVEHTIEKAGLLTTSSAAKILAENYYTKSEMKTEVDGQISRASIKANQVEILSDHFKVLDGDVYADSLTLTGAFNNMLTEVSETSGYYSAEKYGEYITCLLDGSPTLYGSPDWLTCGSLVKFTGMAGKGINLPFYTCTPDNPCVPSAGDNSDFRYVRTATKFGTGELHKMTMAEMKQLIGRKFYLMNTESTGMMTVYYGVPMNENKDGSTTYISWDNKDTDYMSVGVPAGGTLIMECCLGGYKYGDAYYECIYWQYVANIGTPLVEFDDGGAEE